MTLLMQLLMGTVMIGLTVTIHASFLDFVIKNAGRWEKFLSDYIRFFCKPAIGILVVLVVFLAHITEIWLWAGLYLGLDSLPHDTLSEALYFATVTYTTLGYGDIVLHEPYRMLSAIEAANGFLLFGWTTAFIFEVISRIYRHEIRAL